MVYLLQQIVNALPLAALYAALAFGYKLTFGLSRRADLAYGALFAFAGQMTVLFAAFGWNRLFLVLPAALALGAAAGLAYAGGAGLVIARHVMAPLKDRAPNAIIVAALGLSLVLMETARLAADSRDVWISPFLNRPVPLLVLADGPVTLTLIQIVNSAVLVLAVAGASALIAFTRLGRAWAAVAEEPVAAALCGVDPARVFFLSYVASALMAGLAGILAVFYYGNMDFGSGMMFGLKVLVIAAVGGAERPWHAAAGAALMGVAETLFSAYAPLVWRDPVIFSTLVLLLVFSRRETAGHRSL